MGRVHTPDETPASVGLLGAAGPPSAAAAVGPGQAARERSYRELFEREETIREARLRLLEVAAFQPLEQVLTATLDELELLTGSTIGFYHLVEPDQVTIALQTWSTRAVASMCKAEGKGLHYPIASAGVWVDGVRERRAVIHNDYAALPHRKGLPPGHAPVVREVVIPILRNAIVKAVIGVGNKPTEYGDQDVAVLTQLGDLSWDIVERKRAEQIASERYSTLHAILDSLDTTVFSVDRQYRYTSYNARHAEVVRALYGAEVEIGRSLLDLMSVPEDREEARRNLDRALAGEQHTKEAFSGEEQRSRRYLRVSHSPIRAEGGAVIGAAVLSQDLTDRRRAEEALRESEQRYRRLSRELEQRVAERTAELEVANRELEAFAYSASHDLRAPLRHVGGFLDLLRGKLGGALDPQALHYLDSIADAGKRMESLVDDLLAFSRTGRCEMSKAPVDLGALAREVVAELEPDARGRSVDWRVAALPAVSADRAMLKLALSNLLSNALKFTRPRARAEIEVGWRPEPGETVLFVRDNGVGFDMRHADKLFGVFSRLHSKQDFEGNGVGLANVQRIVARHGGRVWAEGRPDEGATFSFSLPAPAPEP